jgi:hypothetical protein
LKNLYLRIIRGNSKLGKIPNISLPPGKTCIAECSFCYARKFYKWKNVKKVWDLNYDLYLNDPERYFSDIFKYINYHNSKRFRFHVGGDIIDQNYLLNMIDLAKKSSKTIFTVYTKKFDLIENLKETPSNLIILLSASPNHLPSECLTKNFRQAWITGLNDSNYNLILQQKENLILCPAYKDNNIKITCEKCKMCYDLNNKKDIVFKLH